MQEQNFHLSDEQLLLFLEGELPKNAAGAAREHVEGCWRCRARCKEFEQAIGDFIRVHQDGLEAKLPAAGPRALLRAQMAERVSAESGNHGFAARVPLRALWAAAACVALAVGWLVVRTEMEWRSGARPGESVSLPDASLTPGATVLLSRQAVCREENIKNKTVPVALRRRVFQEYGMPRAESRAYEVDYLITPALGGAEDIHNLWPQPYSSVWNAQVKDELEDRLRELVCSGSLDLSEAQREIASDWVGAYKKYFHTDRPLEEHRRSSSGANEAK
ncbi:MAG TPA: hypothetical protein VG675_19600 [Bryobacteraceae bacterium]|nr:hypothetical protein [Bryobacteraceae bacterium]